MSQTSWIFVRVIVSESSSGISESDDQAQSNFNTNVGSLEI